MKTKIFLGAIGLLTAVVAFALGYFDFGIYGVSTMLAVTPICAALAGDNEPDCDFPVQGGVEDLLYLINKADIETIVRDVANPLIIEDIILVSGATAFKVQGQNNSNNTRFELVLLRFTRSWNHFVDFIGFDLSPEGSKRLEEYANGLMVALVINNYRGNLGKAAIKIYGLDAGLRAGAVTQDMANADTQGAFQIVLQTNELNKEPHVPAHLWDTDFATSLAKVEALV